MKIFAKVVESVFPVVLSKYWDLPTISHLKAFTPQLFWMKKNVPVALFAQEAVQM
jgi:hypothetical protein